MLSDNFEYIVPMVMWMDVSGIGEEKTMDWKTPDNILCNKNSYFV